MVNPLKVDQIINMVHSYTLTKLYNFQEKVNFLYQLTSNYVDVKKGFMHLLKKALLWWLQLNDAARKAQIKVVCLWYSIHDTLHYSLYFKFILYEGGNWSWRFQLSHPHPRDWVGKNYPRGLCHYNNEEIK